MAPTDKPKPVPPAFRYFISSFLLIPLHFPVPRFTDRPRSSLLGVKIPQTISLAPIIENSQRFRLVIPMANNNQPLPTSRRPKVNVGTEVGGQIRRGAETPG
jgi:hypothetical protein